MADPESTYHTTSTRAHQQKATQQQQLPHHDALSPRRPVASFYPPLPARLAPPLAHPPTNQTGVPLCARPLACTRALGRARPVGRAPSRAAHTSRSATRPVPHLQRSVRLPSRLNRTGWSAAPQLPFFPVFSPPRKVRILLCFWLRTPPNSTLTLSVLLFCVHSPLVFQADCTRASVRHVICGWTHFRRRTVRSFVRQRSNVVSHCRPI